MEAEAFEAAVLREAAYNLPGIRTDRTSEPVTLQDMHEWLAAKALRGSQGARSVRASIESSHAPFKALEQKFQGVWGQTTTPAMQTLECIQKVKVALTEQNAEDSMSSTAFLSLLSLLLMLVVAVVCAWELKFKPRLPMATHL